MEKIEIAGVAVNKVGKQQALQIIDRFVQSNTSHYIVTPYSEFIVEAQKNENFRQAVNQADLSLPDGIGILWAAEFLSRPKRNALATAGAWFLSLLRIILAPHTIRRVIPERVTGSRLVWPLAELAAQKGYRVALVGGYDGAAEKTAAALKRRFPELSVSLVLEPQTFDAAAVQAVKNSGSDILLVAYQPPKQEIWLWENRGRLGVKAAIGLGGTFDYISGKRPLAPEAFHRLGLEWLWRLVTQPRRLARIWRATVVYSLMILREKLKHG